MKILFLALLALFQLYIWLPHAVEGSAEDRWSEVFLMSLMVISGGVTLGVIGLRAFRARWLFGGGLLQVFAVGVFFYEILAFGEPQVFMMFAMPMGWVLLGPSIISSVILVLWGAQEVQRSELPVKA